MKAFPFEGVTRFLGKPKGWKQEFATCSELPIRDVDYGHLGSGMESVWEFTEEERERIANGENLCLTVLGERHPPVSLNLTNQKSL